jgi:hypothetical protein
MEFERNTEVTGNDLLEGVRVLRGGMALMSDHARKVGFVETSLLGPAMEPVTMGRR